MNEKFGTPVVPISWGELIDKITILEIKNLKIVSITAKKNISKELKYLLEIAVLNKMPKEIDILKNELSNVNLKLWGVEDQIREKELAGEFDETFIELARSVYRLNDIRAKTKQSINIRLCSELVEEKSYKHFEVKGEQKKSEFVNNFYCLTVTVLCDFKCLQNRKAFICKVNCLFFQLFNISFRCFNNLTIFQDKTILRR
jgi:hypothetical protein